MSAQTPTLNIDESAISECQLKAPLSGEFVAEMPKCDTKFTTSNYVHFITCDVVYRSSV